MNHLHHDFLESSSADAKRLADIYLDAARELAGRATMNYELEDRAIANRIKRTIEKHLLKHDAKASEDDIKRFARTLAADDLCLALACEAGDEAAWRDLMRNFRATVDSSARVCASANVQAEDLANSVWAELYGWRESESKDVSESKDASRSEDVSRSDKAKTKTGKLAYYSGCGSLGGFLRAVVAQLATDDFRRTRRFIPVADERELDSHEHAALADNAEGANANGKFSPLSFIAPDPEQALEKRERNLALEDAFARAVETLAAEDKLLLKLYYFDALKLKEAGAIIGVSEATASRRVARMHKDLRQSIEDFLRRERKLSEAEISSAFALFEATLEFEKVLETADAKPLKINYSS